MSKKYDKLQREARTAKKKAVRKANQERHNQTSEGTKKKGEKKKHLTSHPYGACGNIGCKRCNPFFNKKEVNEIETLTPKELYLKRVGINL